VECRSAAERRLARAVPVDALWRATVDRGQRPHKWVVASIFHDGDTVTLTTDPPITDFE
jgi:hypothetical protein